MIFKFNSILVVLATIAISACNSIPVSQDFEQYFDHSRLKTFAWQSNDNNEWGLADNEIVDRRIRNAIADTLVTKQFTQVETGHLTSSSVITWSWNRGLLATTSAAAYPWAGQREAVQQASVSAPAHRYAHTSVAPC